MTPEARAELRALAEAATSGPWLAHRVRHQNDWRVDAPTLMAVAELRGQETSAVLRVSADAAFIAACRTDVPALLDALDAAEDALRYQHDAAYGDNGATWREALRRVTAVLGEDLLSADRVYPDRTAELESENARLSALVKDLRAALAVLP